MLYLGNSLDKVMAFVRKEMSNDNETALLAMIPGYYKNVLPNDLDRYKVLDIEHHFSFVPCDPETGEVIDPDVEVCGSIDMIVLDVAENAIYGFEHKTCKNFRDTSFMWMDEQPRVYTHALGIYVQEYNRKHQNDEGFEPVTLGGIYINEVKKLLRDFKYQRTLCKYPESDMKNFMRAFFGTCCACHQDVVNNDPGVPSPSYFGCSMCDYRTICETYMYATLDKDEVINEFQEEFKVRESDHLEEKAERTNDK
jgi:hypothetical protein